MVFHKFYWRILIRVLVLTIFLGLFSYSFVNGYYLRSGYMAVFSGLVVTELVFYVYRFTKNIELFLVNIRQREFTLHFPESDRTFGALFHELNAVTVAFGKLSSEKEIQHRFLQTLIKHVSVGIISFDAKGEVQLVNDSFLKLIGKIRVSSLSHLSSLNPPLAAEIERLRPEETSVVKLQTGSVLQNVALFCSEFKLDQNHYKLVSLQNITNELNAQELEAWQKLIRVLTHEIMNSIAPIVSLSDTLFTMAKQQNDDTKFIQTLTQGLEAIKIRGEGLQHFTDAYRTLTRIPTPEFKNVTSRDVVSAVVDLLRPEIERRGIVWKAEVQNTEMIVDQKLLEQVLINLAWNAIDAVDGLREPSIILSVESAGVKTKITVTDNGPGIEESIKDKIFVPFFTTKKNGSGIGLALARQIIQMHKGVLQVESTGNSGTKMTILL